MLMIILVSARIPSQGRNALNIYELMRSDFNWPIKVVVSTLDRDMLGRFKAR